MENSMPEVTPSGEQHGDVALVAQINRFLITLGAARLHDGVHAGVDQGFGAVWERKEGVAGRDGAA